MIKRYLLAVSLIAQMICGAVAQQTGPVGPPPPPGPQSTPPQKPDDTDVVKITTNLVQVDAVVTDKNGKVITDLKPEEIEILEDGRKQKVTHFSYNATETPALDRSAKSAPADKNAAPIPPSKLRPEDVRRTIAVVVDDLGLSFESTYYVRRALKKFIDEQMEPGDLVAIIRTSGGMGALQQFTADKRQLYAAIDHVRWRPMGRGGSASFAPIEAAPLAVPETGDGNHAHDADAFRAEVFSVGTLGAISYVVRGLRDLPGRKSILLLSDGIMIYNPGDPERTNRVLDALNQLTDLANRASVVIYTMDARGLEPLGLQARDNTQRMTIQQIQQQLTLRREQYFESQNGLNYLAQQTGGLPIRNTNDLSGSIQRVLEDQRGYYLIGYRPDESTFDPKNGSRKFHHLSLKVTRPGKFNVRMRNGFYGVSDEEIKPAEKTAAQQLLTAITSPFGTTGVRLQLTSLFANDATNGSFMRSLLHIDAHDLTFKDGPNGTHEAVFDVLAMTFGDNGVPVDYSARTYTIDLPDAWYQRAMREGLVYNITVPIKRPGAYQFRMSLRDRGTERTGSASQFIEVPDLNKDRLALSGIVLSGTTVATTSTAANPPASREATDQTNPEASPAVRHFKQGMQLEYGYLIYNARLDKATQKPQLTTQVRLFREGRQVFGGGEQPFNVTNQTDLQRLVISGALILGTDLAPGEYVLQVVVTDLLADKKTRTTTQWMDFEITK